MKEAEIRSICKDKIESLELWLRRLIEDTLTPLYGDYFDYTDAKGNRIISTKLSQSVEERQKKEPKRYPRKIDAVLLEDAVNIICKRDLYQKHFRPAIVDAFPHGEEEARTFLSRLLVPRNNLAHANAISHRQAEQIICYSNDVIDSLKKYYNVIGMQQEYNVPLILKVTDSFGRTFTRSQMGESAEGGIFLFNREPEYWLRSGDMITLEVEIDPAFEQDSYQIKWLKNGYEEPNTSAKIAIRITNSEVGELFLVRCMIKSHNDWHRMIGEVDDVMAMHYRVLPPLE